MVKESLSAPYPYYLLDAESSQDIDRKTIQETGINGFTLMEVAGSSAAKILLGKIPSNDHGIYLCGKGNNGGDALVVARYLLQHNISATIIFISGADGLSDDCTRNLKLLKQFDTKGKINIHDAWNDFESPGQFDFIVDGMLGTGLSDNLRGDYNDAVHWANSRDETTYSMDIPTGLHPDSGKIMGAAIQADHTLAFGGRKIGFYLESGPSSSGKIHFCELPFPNKYKEECSVFLMNEQWISAPSLKPGKHKYDAGVLYIIAGSEGLTGAATMCSKSAWAEGLGAVILICPRGNLDVYEYNLPSIIKKPVGNRGDVFFKEEHTDEILNIIQQKQGKVLLGPGLGRKNETVEFVQKFTASNPTDILIDADGLWGLSQKSDWEKPSGVNWIITPHPGELHTLTGQKIGNGLERLKVVGDLSVQKEVTVLSKGFPGIIGTPSGKAYITDYETRYFSRAGSGDVLAGKVAAYFALNHTSDRSCALGLLNGKQKMTAFLNKNDKLPEPSDFI